MKTNIFILILALLVGNLHATPPASRDTRVIMSPTQLKDDPAYQTLMLYVFHQLSPGSTLSLFDGYRLKSIAEFHLPADFEGDEISDRKRLWKQPLVQTAVWFQENSKGNNPAPYTLKLPQAVEMATEGVSGQTDVIVYGSCIATDGTYRFVRPDEEGASQYYYPSDAFIATKRTHSPYGALGAPRRGHVRLHLAFPGEDIFFAEHYRSELKRFYGLWARANYGGLYSFQTGLDSALASAANPSLQPLRYEFNREHRELIMLRSEPKIEVKEVEAEPLRIDFDALSGDQANIQIESATPLSEAENLVVEEFNHQSHEGFLSIGITWDEPGVDLDLWLFRDDGTYLSFAHKRHAYGYFVKDQRSAPGLDWEQIVMTEKGGVIEAYANLFGSKEPLTKPLRGKYMVHYEGKTLVRPFTITASKGDGGQKANMRKSNTAWTRLSLVPPLIVANKPSEHVQVSQRIVK